MSKEQDEELPLHAEAEAHSAWRGDETILADGGADSDLPASEVDDAAAPGSAGGREPVSPGTVAPPD